VRARPEASPARPFSPLPTAWTAAGHLCLALGEAEPLLPLRRAWCLWELLCAARASATSITVAHARRSAGICAAFGALRRALEGLDVAAAEATRASERAMIEQAIGTTCASAGAASALVARRLNEVLLLEGALQLSSLSAADRATSVVVCDLALLMLGQGKAEAAEALLREAVLGRQLALGSANPRTLIAMGCLAQLLRANGGLEEAEALQEQVARPAPHRTLDAPRPARHLARPVAPRAPHLPRQSTRRASRRARAARSSKRRPRSSVCCGASAASSPTRRRSAARRSRTTAAARASRACLRSRGAPRRRRRRRLLPPRGAARGATSGSAGSSPSPRWAGWAR
jgi:hypothetical protein